VRFDWKDITHSSARWEQSFSFDDGRTFDTSWIMEFERGALGGAEKLTRIASRFLPAA